MDNGRGLIKALETWAKNVTKGYRDVNVRDMSVSFRDGLAFCAIIHHYRPDLIDFDSLSKENILENNQLAFSVAEKQLGVPALLDAEDMVQFSRPDRLSIITYLSQLHNCFENQNKMQTGFKRLQNNNISTRPSKVIVAEPALTSRRIEVCQKCSNRVFILERLIVDSKLYHTACFRCCKCDALLNPGAYVESDTPGKYECTVCPTEDKMSSMETDDTESHSSLEEKCDASVESVPLRTVQNNVTKSPLSESVSQARVSFLQRSLNKADGAQSSTNFSIGNKIPSPIDNELPRNSVSVKDKISVFESSKVSRIDSAPTSKLDSPQTSKLDSPPTPEPISPVKLRESLATKSPSPVNKYPQPSVRLSKLTTVTPDKNEKITNDTKSISSDEVDASNAATDSKEKEALKTLPTNLDSHETKSDCDNLSSKETPVSDPAVSPGNVTPMKTFKKDLDKGNVTYKSSIGEYKSPLKSSRDIFQANIQPLKLVIPTISSSKSETSSLPSTPLSSTDSVKSSEIAQLRSSYNKSLSRPLSSSSLQFKLKTEEIDESSSSKSLPRENKETIVRRKSLDSNKDSELKIKSDESKDPFSNTSNEQKKTTFETLSPTAEKKSPIPTIRHSIESKKLDLHAREIKPSIEKPKPLLPRSPIVQKKVENATAKTDAPGMHPVSKDPEEKEYPDDLNPFGDDEEKDEEEYPDDLNPFGDDEEVVETKPPKVFEGVCADNYDEAKNPFASDEEEAESSLTVNTPSPRPYGSGDNSPFGTISSPTGSLRGTTKKRKAPQPPKMSDIFPTTNSPDSSLKPSPSVSRRGLETPSPKLRKSKPAPPPPTPSPRQNSNSGASPSGKQTKEDEVKQNAAAKELKRKKRPAPPVPIPMRKDKKKIPLKEILREMKEIEAKQRELETQGRQLELLIRDKDKDEEPTVEEEEFIMQLFDLVNQKNALFRRQAELMYIKRSQRLEEQQEELEKQIRELMAKPESDKTEEEKVKEEELIYELTDIVDQRNSIIDSIEMDRRREMEEDVSVQEQIVMKNGDLPIAAELKEKSKGKDKKEKKEEKKKKKKEKKEKKKEKNQENGDSGKNTLKKKLFK